MVKNGIYSFFRALEAVLRRKPHFLQDLPELPRCTSPSTDQDLPIKQVQFKPKKVKEE